MIIMYQQCCDFCACREIQAVMLSKAPVLPPEGWQKVPARTVVEPVPLLHVVYGNASTCDM